MHCDKCDNFIFRREFLFFYELFIVFKSIHFFLEGFLSLNSEFIHYHIRRICSLLYCLEEKKEKDIECDSENENTEIFVRTDNGVFKAQNAII